MTVELFHSDFALIHKQAAACGENFVELEALRKKLKYKSIPELIEQYKNATPDISWSDAYLAVRKAHIEYIGTLFPRDGISAQPIPEIDIVSKQTPVLDKDEKFHCCYRRDEVGLPAFRRHTLTFGLQELISWYHHSSPVPYEIKDLHERLAATIQNLEQLPGKTIAEIRLLSPMKGLKEKFSAPFAKKYFTTLNDYDQLLETAIAAELSRKQILLFNLGVNYGRKHASSLQKQINIRALKTLLSQIPLSGVSVSPDMFSLSLGDENIKTSFLTQLALQNPEEYSELPQDIDSSSATDEQKKLYKEIMELLSTGNWIHNNFQAQAKLVKLNYLLGHTVATGCNDAKDRDGELTNVIEANEIASHVTGYSVEEALPLVRENSTAKQAAEMVSMPAFAKGLDAESNPHRNVSKIFKLIYTENQHEEYKKRDANITTAQLQLAQLPKKQNFLAYLGTCVMNAVNGIKKLGRGIATLFWSVLLTVGIITAASASTDMPKDGLSSSSDSTSFSVPISSDGTSPSPQPVGQRKEDPVDDLSDDEEGTALNEEDCYSSTHSSSNTSPVSSRKLTEEDNTRIAQWIKLRGKNHGNTVSMVQAAMKQGLISNKRLSGGYSLSDAAQAERDKIPRRFTQ